VEWYLKVLKNYVGFGGRAQRKEYWMFVLINVIIGVALTIVGGVVGLDVLGSLYMLAVLLPGVAVGFRRLHDIGKSGWWILISLIPLIGALVLLYFMVLDGDQEDNQYGPNPKAA
jgi:uncharacterized membrane protein YhaH (DUF805 family)